MFNAIRSKVQTEARAAIGKLSYEYNVMHATLLCIHYDYITLQYISIFNVVPGQEQVP